MRRAFTSSFFNSNQLVAEFRGEAAGYRVLGLLGTGAGSQVFEVQDPSDGQRYAMKVVKKKVDKDQRFLDQAINEHEVAGKLDYPLLRKSVRLIRQGGLMGTTEVMLLMELVDGVTLDKRQPKGRRLMVSVFKSVARALAAMHAAGLVHADIKPINILLTNGGSLKVIDFGQSCPVNTVKTRIQGTLDYIAPEQVARAPITPRTDIYNLGATMYWCATSHHPPSVLRPARRVGERRNDNEPKELVDPRHFSPDLPPALCSLILDCLRHDPAQRPRTMTDVEQRLDMARIQAEKASAKAAEPAPGLEAAEAAEPPASEGAEQEVDIDPDQALQPNLA